MVAGCSRGDRPIVLSVNGGGYPLFFENHGATWLDTDSAPVVKIYSSDLRGNYWWAPALGGNGCNLPHIHQRQGRRQAEDPGLVGTVLRFG